MRKFIPAGYRLLVKVKPIEKEQEKKSDGGILLEVGRTKSQLQREQEAVSEAYVMDIANEAYVDIGSGKPWCKVGQLVLISRYSGVLVDMGDAESVYRAINDKDVIGHYEGEDLK